jgi:energy-coupling factor transporter transmembrane protein EcfT
MKRSVFSNTASINLNLLFSIILGFGILTFIYLFPNIFNLLPAFAILLIWIISIIVKSILKKDFKAVIIPGIIILTTFILVIPIQNYGFKYGPTFGKQIRYNKKIWEKPWNANLRYFMVDDIIRIIKEGNYSEKKTIEMLGKSEYKHKRDLEYFLRSESFVGLAMATLEIEIDNDKVLNIYIAHSD